MSFDSDVNSNNSAISRCSEWVSSERLTDAVRPMPAVAAVNAARMRGGEKPRQTERGERAKTRTQQSRGHRLGQFTVTY